MMLNLMIAFILSFSIAIADDPCRFEFPGKGVIDITTLGHIDGTPAFAHRKPVNASPTSYLYNYNPCRTFSLPEPCQNVAACQSNAEERAFYLLDRQESALWSPGNDNGADPTVTYSGDLRKAIVILVCSTNGSEEFEVVGEEPAYTYTFRLTSKCACWNGCTCQDTTTTTSKPASSACRFEHPEKGVIDFSFIGRTDEKAAYSDETTRTTSNFKYSFNPCRSFSQESGCIGASICQISNDGEETFTLGTQESAWWDTGSNGNSLPSVNYVYGDKKASVLLQCSNEGNNEFQAFGEDPANTFKFQLTHKCACWNGCSKN